MSYIPILEDLTALGDELAEIGDDALTGAAVKAGARNSAADAQTIQEIAEAASDILDLAIELGAAHPDGEGEPAEAAISDDALKAMYDDPIAYAQHECQDIAGGCQALQALAMLMQSELSEDYEEDEEGTIAKLASAMRSIVGFIASEIDAIEESKTGETKAINYDQSAQLVRDAWAQTHPGENGGPCNSWPQVVYDNAIIVSEQGKLWYVPYQSGENQIIFADRGGWQQARQVYVTSDGAEIKAQRTFGGKQRDDLKDEDFAGPDRTYPIMSAKDVKDAARLIGKAKDPDAVKKRIIAIAKKKGFEDALPPFWRGATKADEGYAVKMLGDDEVFGPAIWLNGSPDNHDLSRERDFFTKSTDFWLDHWDRRPMLWHHGQDEGDILIEMRQNGASPDEIKAIRDAFAHLRENPVIGVWTKATADPIAVWLHGQLNKAHRYRSAIKELVARGLIKISTDSAPHLVVREPRPNNTNEVKRWPIVAGSLTVSAAEPRLFDVQAVKAWYDEAGIPMPGEVAEIKTDDERQRALLIEIGLLELTEDMAG